MGHAEQQLKFSSGSLGSGVGQWSDQIQQTAQSTGVDPNILATIMKMESDGDPNSRNHNSNGTNDWGLMQINDSTIQDLGLDPDRVKNDPMYNLWAAAQEVKSKQDTAQRLGLDPNNPFNIFWLYNGYSDQGKRYAEKAMDTYNSIS